VLRCRKSDVTYGCVGSLVSAGMTNDDAVQLRLLVGVCTAVWLCVYEYIHEVSSST